MAKSKKPAIEGTTSEDLVLNPVIDHIREMYASSGIANTFLVFGNIHDYQRVVAQTETYYLRLPTLIGSYFEKSFDLVCMYDHHSWQFQCHPKKSEALSKVTAIMDMAKNGGSSGSGEEKRSYESEVNRNRQGQNRGLDLNALFGSSGSGQNGPLRLGDKEALEDLETLMMTAEGSLTIVLDFAEAYLASGPWGTKREVDFLVSRILRWATNKDIRNKGHLLIILASDYSALHPALKDPDNAIEKIEIIYPTTDERKDFIEFWIKSTLEVEEGTTDNDAVKSLRKADPGDLARATAGLNYSAVCDILVYALASPKGIDYTYVKQRKDQIIKHSYNDVIEVPTPERGWDFVGGLDYIRDFMHEHVVVPLKEGNIEGTPKGVLFMGPPGTGKSLAAEATSKEANVTFIKFNPAKVFDKWVGSSERNMQRVLDVIGAMTPCIVFIDEMDQTGADREGFDGTGGTQKRVFRALLERMGEDSYRGKVIFLAATNRPDLMDAAMKRAGRFDKKLAFLVPNKSMRKDLFKTMAAKYGIEGLILNVSVLNATEGWVPVDIEEIVRKAKELIGLKKATPKTALDLAVKFIRPSVKPETVSHMASLALQEVNDLSTLPDDFVESAEYRSLMASQAPEV